MIDLFGRRRLRELREAYDKINAALYDAELDCARLRGENRVLGKALAKHDLWCGYNRDAPGDRIISDPVVVAAMTEERER